MRPRRVSRRHEPRLMALVAIGLAVAVFASGTAPASAELLRAEAPATPAAEEPAPEQPEPDLPPPEQPDPAAPEPPAAGEPAPQPSETEPPVTGEPAPQPSATESSGPGPSPSPEAPGAPAAPTASTEDSADVGVLAVPEPGATTAVITVKVGSDRTGITGVTNLAGVVLILNEGERAARTARGRTASRALRTDGRDASPTPRATARSSFRTPARGLSDFRRRTATTAIGSCRQRCRRGTSRTPRCVPGPAPVKAPQRRIASAPAPSCAQAMCTARRTPATSCCPPDCSSPRPPAAYGSNHGSTRRWTASCGLDVALILDLSGSVGTERGSAQGCRRHVRGLAHRYPVPDGAVLLLHASPRPKALPRTFPASPRLPRRNRARPSRAGTPRGRPWAGRTGIAGWASPPFRTPRPTTSTSPSSSPTAIRPSTTSPIRAPATTTASARSRTASSRPTRSRPAPPSDHRSRLVAFGVGAGASGTATALNLRAISRHRRRTTAPTRPLPTTTRPPDYCLGGIEPCEPSPSATARATLTVTKQIVPEDRGRGLDRGRNARRGRMAVHRLHRDGRSDHAGSGAHDHGRRHRHGRVPPHVPRRHHGRDRHGHRDAPGRGSQLQPVEGQNAACTNLDTGEAVAPAASPTDGFTVAVPSTQAVNCIVYNRAALPEAELTVSKNWVVNDVAYPEGAQPSDLTAQLLLTGPDGAPASGQGWGVSRSGYTQGDTVTLSEELTLIDPAAVHGNGRGHERQRGDRGHPVGHGL